LPPFVDVGPNAESAGTVRVLEESVVHDERTHATALAACSQQNDERTPSCTISTARHREETANGTMSREPESQAFVRESMVIETLTVGN
jgi:hypothetical protein